MRKIFIAIILMGMVPAHSIAMPATTSGGEVGCLTKEWYKEMVSFVAAGDRDSFAAYIENKRCIVVKRGLKVTVIEGPGLLGGTVGYIFKGYKFWGSRESLKYGE